MPKKRSMRRRIGATSSSATRPEALKGWRTPTSRSTPNAAAALEARYNRALSLVRLDRRDDARAALAPFANGTYGGYREREARELFDALQSAP